MPHAAGSPGSGGGGFSVGFSIFSTILGLYESRQESNRYEAAAAEAERIGLANAAATEAETQERIRVTKLAQEATEATARARGGASQTTGGSLGTGVSVLSAEHERQLSWMRISGESQRRNALRQGRYASSTASASASTAKAKGITNALAGGFEAFGLAKKHTNWFE